MSSIVTMIRQSFEEGVRQSFVSPEIVICDRVFNQIVEEMYSPESQDRNRIMNPEEEKKLTLANGEIGIRTAFGPVLIKRVGKG